jgi:putative sterol carrier protein
VAPRSNSKKNIKKFLVASKDLLLLQKNLKDMNLEEITNYVIRKVGNDCGIGALVKFAFEDGTCVHVDAKQVPNVVSNEDLDADCTVRISKEDFKAITEGSLSPMTAVMFGKIKIEGNMGIAMQIQKIL